LKTTPAAQRWYIPYVYLLIVLPCLLYTIYYTGRAIWLDYTPIPIWDTWRCVQYVDQLLRFDLSHFWVQHNEHRIVFPEMVYALDFIFLKGRLLLPPLASIACQFVQLGLLWWLISRMGEVPIAVRLTLAVCCAMLMTTAFQVQGILGAFLLQWYLSQMAAALSLWLLWSSWRSGSLGILVLSIAAAVVATYSSGNGMLLWPVLVMMAVILHLPKLRIAGLILAGVLSIGGYLIGYQFMGQGRVAIVLAHPVYAVWFMGVFAGAPVSYISTWLGGAVGIISFLLVGAAILVVVRHGRQKEPALLVTAGVCMFIIASAALTAYGRMNPNDPSVIAATAPRYVSVPFTYWANLIVVTVWLATRLPRGRTVALHGVALGFVVMVLAVARIQGPHERVFAAQQARAHESGLALEDGIQDSVHLGVLFPDPGFVRDSVTGIRQRRLSIFATGYQDWIHQPLARLFIAGPTELCSGGVATLTALPGGYRASGWAIDRKDGTPPHDIVLTNAAGIILGFGETRPGGYPQEHPDPQRRQPSASDWVGFAADDSSGSVQAYGIVRNGVVACALGPPQQVPHATPVDAQTAGAVIPVVWKADPAWTRNGFHPSVGTLPGETLYGSYSGSDTNQGSLISTAFETAGHACIAFAVAHGPSVGGQSVNVVNAGTGLTIESIPLSEAGGDWQFWAVEFQGTPELQIVAEDKGDQWGQWVAISEPHWCKSD
jgi:hypothetical protein